MVVGTRICLPCLIVLVTAPLSALAVAIPTVPVGNAGNGYDPASGGLLGGVAYKYHIGATEVTNAQYVAFLNAKAASDPLALYNPNMGSNAFGGIARSGSPGSYTYVPKANMADKPVVFVSWYDSLRFINWLHNGQGSGDTETGAYTLLGGTPIPSNEGHITRNAGATWFLPDKNEWYKAAFYQPPDQGGDADGYWLYATATNSAPTVATANAVGDIDNPGPNVVNYGDGVIWNGLTGNLTSVGSAGPLSRSFYGTYDQSGNVYEWTESVPGGATNPEIRQLRGGAYDSASESFIDSNQVISFASSNQNALSGFRVATIPEPSSYLLGVLALLGMFAFCRRRS